MEGHSDNCRATLGAYRRAEGQQSSDLFSSCYWYACLLQHEDMPQIVWHCVHVYCSISDAFCGCKLAPKELQNMYIAMSC